MPHTLLLPGPPPAARRARPWLAVVLAVLAVILASACGSGSRGGGQPATVAVTSFYPLYYLTTTIAGERLTVRNLVPAGAEPHDWEPSTRDMVALKDAALFVYNGAGFEAWVPKALQAAPSSRRVTVEAAAGLPLATEPGTSGADPHLWLDPILYKAMGARVAGALARVDPAGKETFDRNLAALNQRLDDLDAAYRAGLARCARHEIITSHAAFGYLARRYGLEQIAVEGLSPDAEPTPARIADVTRLARERGATHIFFETLVSPRVAQTIASEVGARTLVLDPIEGLAEPGQHDYVTVMQANLVNLRTALGCQE